MAGIRRGQGERGASYTRPWTGSARRYAAGLVAGGERVSIRRRPNRGDAGYPPGPRRPCTGGCGLTRFHLHLVSDSTGDTVHSVARACLVQFEDAEAIEHIWSMVRTKAQIDRVITGVAGQSRRRPLHPGQRDAARRVQDGCRRLVVPVIPVLDPVIGALTSHLGAAEPRPARSAASARQRIFRPHRRDDLRAQPR